MTLFPDQQVNREAAQWKTIFSTPSVDISPSQVFSNFGSITEPITPEVDYDAVVRSIAEHLAEDVYQVLKDDLIPTMRSKTAQSHRDARNVSMRVRPTAMARTPMITPNHSKRPIRAVQSKSRLNPL